MDENVPSAWGDDPEDERRAREWHDFEVFRGKAYPVLFYTIDHPRYWRGRPVSASTVTTEPCIWCGSRHHHGNGPGSRVPHCAGHSHELTPTGRRRSVYAKNVAKCPNYHRDYILRERKEVTDGYED